jgi:hypothetical protein
VPFSIARTFGSQGFDVALISRNREKLDGLVGEFAADGITAAAFPADVLDRDALTQALKDAASRFGGIDVLEYSPVGAFGVIKLPAPAGAGTLLYTTGAGSIWPDPRVAHVGIDSSIGVSVIPGVEAAKPEQIAPLYWELHTTKRDEAELVFRLDAEGFPRA